MSSCPPMDLSGKQRKRIIIAATLVGALAIALGMWWLYGGYTAKRVTITETPQIRRQRELAEATHKGKVEAVKAILSEDESLATQELPEDQCTPLHIAAWDGRKELA